MHEREQSWYHISPHNVIHEWSAEEFCLAQDDNSAVSPCVDLEIIQQDMRCISLWFFAVSCMLVSKWICVSWEFLCIIWPYKKKLKEERKLPFHEKEDSVVCTNIWHYHLFFVSRACVLSDTVASGPSDGVCFSCLNVRFRNPLLMQITSEDFCIVFRSIRVQ